MRTLAALAILLTSPLFAQTALCTQIKSLTAVSPAHWGISITTLDGTPLCQIDEAKLFRPASNAKLFTTAAALALLGPGLTFETKVAGDFNPKTGIVTGDLTLIGGGDANLDSGDLPYQPHPTQPAPPFAFHDLEDLAQQLLAKGVKTITGNIIGDDTLFPYEPYPTAWELDDLVWGYGAPVSALTLADNQLKLTVTPQPGRVALVTLDQHGIDYYTLQSDITTVPPNTPNTGLQMERLPGSRTLHLHGTIAAGAFPLHEDIAIDDPAAYAAMVFRQILLAHGITIRGIPQPRHNDWTRPGASFVSQLHTPLENEDTTIDFLTVGGTQSFDCLHYAYPPTLAAHASSPISADVLFTLKESQNLHAELLQHALGRVVPCFTGSAIAGARLIRAFLLHAGISPDDTLLYDGSGLSSHDLVTPRALTQLLTYAAKQPWFSTFKAALPIGGVDGTLSARFTGETEPQLKGKVFAKTGTLGETRALSGYLTAASGQTLIFSILVDNHLPDSHDDRTLTDHLLALIAAAN